MNAATPSTDSAREGTYQLEADQSFVSFRTRHLFGLGRVRGAIALREGELNIEDPVAESWVQATLDASSFRSRNVARDAAVRSPRFLDTDSFPDIAFVSTAVEPAEDGWVIRGELTVRAVTSEVVLHATGLRCENGHLDLTARARLDRYEAGVTAARGLAARYLDLDIRVVATRVDALVDTTTPRHRT